MSSFKLNTVLATIVEVSTIISKTGNSYCCAGTDGGFK